MTEGHDILPFLLYALTVAALLAVTLTAAWFIGAKARHGGARTLPFESGVVRRAMPRRAGSPSSST